MNKGLITGLPLFKQGKVRDIYDLGDPLLLVTLLKAKAAAMVDTDLVSITPEWIKLLVGFIMGRSAAFVAPFYRRHKFDGTITNHIVYPITRAETALADLPVLPQVHDGRQESLLMTYPANN